MLELFRSQSRSLVIYILLGIVILAFILTFNTQGPISAAPGAVVETLVEVDGTAIDSRELALAKVFSPDPPSPSMTGIEKLQAVQRYELRRLIWSGVSQELAALTPFDGAVPGVEDEKVMTELIESVLVAKAAEAAGMGVSDEELSERVARLELVFATSFRDEQGEFDAKKYDIFVRYQLGTTKSTLESFLRREILRDKYALAAVAGLEISDAELDAADAAESKRPKLEVVTIDARSAKAAVQVSDEDAAVWAAGHVTEVQAAYDTAGETYNRPAKWVVRGILVKATEKAGVADDKKVAVEAEWADKRKAADAIYGDLDKVWKGEVAIDVPGEEGQKKASELQGEQRTKALLAHFSKIAEEKTEHDLTKDVGGRFIDGKSAVVLGLSPFGPAVAQAVGAASEGGLVGPVEGEHGHWILVVEKAEAAVVQPLASVQTAIAKGLVAEERAAGKLDDVAKTVLEAAQAASGKTLAEAVKGWNKAHGGKEDGPLTAMTTGAIGKSPSAALSKGIEAMLGLPPRQESDDDVPGIGVVKGLGQAAWKLRKDAPLAGTVFSSEDAKSRYVVRLAEESTATTDAEGEAKRREALRDTLLQQKRVEVWRSVVKALLQKAETDKKIERSDAWNTLVEQERQRLVEAQKRAASLAPPAPTGLNPTFAMPSGGEPMKIELGGAPPAPAGDEAPAAAPAVAPAAPAEPAPAAAPAAPAEPAPAAAPAEPAPAAPAAPAAAPGAPAEPAPAK